MSDRSSSGMSIDHKSIQQRKECKTYSKTAHKCYLASALYDGVEDGNLSQLTTLLINKGADPNVVLHEYGLAPIHLAVGSEDVQFGYEATKLFLSYRGDPNVRSSDGLTPVHIASLWGRNSVLKLLLANGGDPWISDNDKKNAFCHAHEQQNWSTFKLLDSFKNSIISDRPEGIKRTHYKLHLDRVKVFNNDVCAEYKALPVSSKSCSTQTPPVSSRSRTKTPSITSANFEQDPKMGTLSSQIPCPPAIDVTINRSYDCLDDSFNLKFNICPNKQELQALELVKKHRQGITVFEYVPQSGYHGDNENIGGGSSSYSIGNSSIAGSLHSLVRGSVFADVKSKLKLFYKNVSSNNGSKDSWRLNLIQKRKDKEKLKKEIKKISSVDAFIDCTGSKIFKETLSDSTNMQLQHSSEVIKSIDSKNYDSASETGSCCSKKSRSSLWRFKMTDRQKDKKSNTQINKRDETHSDSFHRFEDVIDSYTFDDINQKNITARDMLNSSTDVCVKKDISSENVGQCICEGICMDILKRINSRTCNANEIGFLVNDNNNSNCLKNVNDNLLLYGSKKDIGFCFDQPLQSNGGLVGDNHSYNLEDISSIHDITSDIETKISQEEEDVGCYATCNQSSQFENHEVNNSVIMTEDESKTSNAFVCFKAQNCLDRNYINTNNSSINNSNLNSTKTSATDVYFSCTSVENSKEISDDKGNFRVNNENESCQILNCSLSQKHVEGITIYESDHASESSISDKKGSNEILNTAFHNSMCTPEEESLLEINCHDSTIAILGSNQASLSESCDVSSFIWNEDGNCNPNSPSGDHVVNEHENFDVIPRIKIPNESSSCSDVNIPKISCNRTFSLQRVEKKWAYADLVSSDEDTDVSIIEEYLYTDEEDGVELVEERHLPTRSSSEMSKHNEGAKQDQHATDQLLVHTKSSIASTGTESESALSTVDTAYETDALRRELKEFGFNAGPITGGTKRIYLRQLKRARRKPIGIRPLSSTPEYSPELERLLKNEKKDLIDNWSHLEIEMSKPFQFPEPSKRWREGVTKTSFTYLLLDPRVTQDLPYRANSLSQKEQLNCFFQAIFYVGRGKRSRPYSHLTEALAVWNRWRHVSSKKVNRILDIWGCGLGVVCLHVFQNVIPVEAMTREAAMIDALGLQCLCNERVGDYYAVASTWNLRQRQQLGAVLLVRALNILLSEGERQIRPPDVGR